MTSARRSLAGIISQVLQPVDTSAAVATHFAMATRAVRVLGLLCQCTAGPCTAFAPVGVRVDLESVTARFRASSCVCRSAMTASGTGSTTSGSGVVQAPVPLALAGCCSWPQLPMGASKWMQILQSEQPDSDPDSDKCRWPKLPALQQVNHGAGYTYALGSVCQESIKSLQACRGITELISAFTSSLLPSNRSVQSAANLNYELERKFARSLLTTCAVLSSSAAIASTLAKTKVQRCAVVF